MKNSELKQLKQSLAELENKFKETLANGEPINNDSPEAKYNTQLNNLASYLFNMIDNLRTYIYKLEDQLYTHASEGHLPKIVGADRMNYCLKTLKLDVSYKAEPKIVYASKNDCVIEAEMPKYE